MKVQLSINDKLMERADEYAERNYLKRSDLFSQAINEYLNTRALQSLLPELVVCMRTIADNDNSIDDETRQQLNEIETMMKLLTNK